MQCMQRNELLYRRWGVYLCVFWNVKDLVRLPGPDSVKEFRGTRGYNIPQRVTRFYMHSLSLSLLYILSLYIFVPSFRDVLNSNAQHKHLRYINGP